MSDFIINCIQSGAYSVVFAVMLVYVIKANLKRERFYRTFISELTNSLRVIGDINGKLDGLIELAEGSLGKKAKKARAKPNFEEAVAYAAGEMS